MFDRRSGPRDGPTGWPPRVPPPGAPGFEVAAAAWLLDHAPPEYRSYPVLRRHPVLLAWLLAHRVDAEADAVRRALRSARVDLVDVLPVEAAPHVFEVLEREELRLRRLRRAVGLLESALRGRRCPPRL